MLYKFPMASVRGFFRGVESFFRGVGEVVDELGDMIAEPFRRMGKNMEDNVRSTGERYDQIGRAHGPDCPRCGGTGQDRYSHGPCSGGR
jgi:hypothetical protein